MNSFLDLHSDSDYRNVNRPYYVGTWEYTNVPLEGLIPFQCSSTGDDITIVMIDTDDVETDISSRFREAFSAISSWSYTGTGTHSSSGATILTWEPADGDYWTSNNKTLSAGDGVRITIDPTEYLSNEDVYIKFMKGTTVLFSEGMDTFSGVAYYVVAEDGTDYNVVIEDDGSSITMASSNVPTLRESRIINSGNYWWYNGGDYSTIPTSSEGIFRIKVTIGTDIFYSDWCSSDIVTDKTKIKLTSSYDYGGIKYVDGYEQWMYKSATVRRGPKAEIEITGDKLNGAIIEEKKVSAVRYKITMKCTESEYEALVHAMGGTLTITDQTGKEYDAVNIEISEPTWHRANSIVELSFVDSNNINQWSRNNSDL